MANHGVYHLEDNTVTLLGLTGEAITAATIFVKGGTTVEILATATETPPTDWSAAYPIPDGKPILNTALADLFPGVTGAARIYGRAENATVVVSYA